MKCVRTLNVSLVKRSKRARTIAARQLWHVNFEGTFHSCYNQNRPLELPRGGMSYRRRIQDGAHRPSFLPSFAFSLSMREPSASADALVLVNSVRLHLLRTLPSCIPVSRRRRASDPSASLNATTAALTTMLLNMQDPHTAESYTSMLKNHDETLLTRKIYAKHTEQPQEGLESLRIRGII